MKIAILLITALFLIAALRKNKSISDPYVAFNVLWLGVATLIIIGNRYVYPAIFSVIGTYACEVLKIGPSSFYNAMPTIFGYFYIDGGFALVFIEAWLFGYICKRLYQRGKSGNVLMAAMYILVFAQICNSSTRCFFYLADYCLAFIL